MHVRGQGSVTTGYVLTFCVRGQSTIGYMPVDFDGSVTTGYVLVDFDILCEGWLCADRL